MKTLLTLCLFSVSVAQAQNPETARLEQRAQTITITRDDWGIAHVKGRTDADAVFGLMYAQAEDDFNRVETNFINAMGRLAEAEGESAVFQDLRMKLFIDPDSLKAMYAASPVWLKALMDGWADGLNFYLFKNPQVKPRVITRFEPWMALSFSEGSIGGDIESVSIDSLRAFYGARPPANRDDLPEPRAQSPEPGGSNGIAIAPQNTINGRALLLINPHTSFFFRSEAQMTSDEGLNAYGASTWGQFFIYQGFNEKAGWMHTSSSVDNIDEFLETIVERDGRKFYVVDGRQRPLMVKKIIVPVKTASGVQQRTFDAYYTHRGPIVRASGGKWVSVQLMNLPLKALQQSYLRTKATDLESYKRVMAIHTNSSNNTLFADASGNIAYFHSNFVPRRDTGFDWRRPVDGSTSRVDWKGLHTFDESPNVVNPPNGWVYNTNNFPYSAAGEFSPKQAAYPKYMDAGSENPRGVHAIMVLKDRKDFTPQRLIDAAFDSYMPAFDDILPPLFREYDASQDAALKTRIAEQLETLRAWNRRWDAMSIATSLGMYYNRELQNLSGRDTNRLQVLIAASDALTADFKTWRTPWGEINRFQRITGDIVHPFDDTKPSIPVPFATARVGSLASFAATPRRGTKKWYGTSGNSFVAVVEFGKDSVRARAITAGGQSGHPDSKHFNDQAVRYSLGGLRPVYFYPNQLAGHIERQYQPGQ
jgi:acyl-homoserine-lactone acylase